ncbi:hypothetical protein [Streptomyces luteireticuli]|uniref:hypothetical protein n=1 Tax=Streptomyces luteireticuli TaxID=173858 RepID=UPI0035568F11
MSKNAPLRVTRGGGPLPTPAVVIVVVVLGVTAGLLAYGVPVEDVVTAVTAGGVAAKEIVRGLAAVFSRDGV